METRARYALIGGFMLAVILASFAFVYWLENKGGFGQRSYYSLKFDSPVSGLTPGSAVLFNGIRVGEVTELGLDPAEPAAVIATIGVDTNTPVRSDTIVGVEMQGLTGGAAVALTGGSADAPAMESAGGVLPVLTADPGATQDWTTLARTVLRRLDAVLSDNADNFHSAIANFNQFTDVLARNSDRIDGILGGLERMTGGSSGGKEASLAYNLTAPTDLKAPAAPPSWQLVLPEPTALLAVNSDKIKVRPSPAESFDVPGAKWADNAPILLQESLIQSFENAGYAQAVSRPRDGAEAAYQLMLDIRTFSLSTEKEPVAELEFVAKILGPDGKIAAARNFETTAPAAGTEPAQAADALNAAFVKAAKDLVPWATGTLDSLPPPPAATEAAPEAPPPQDAPASPGLEVPTPPGGDAAPDTPAQRS
jgi:phospholipid/cholesterol/gamma-HCH transport system substrate-binding protein